MYTTSNNLFFRPCSPYLYDDNTVNQRRSGGRRIGYPNEDEDDEDAEVGRLQETESYVSVSVLHRCATYRGGC